MRPERLDEEDRSLESHARVTAGPFGGGSTGAAPNRVTPENPPPTCRYLRLARRVADLLDHGDRHGALKLLAREGDPAARADAEAALERERRRGGL
jgi:hypothetical protein